VLATVSDIAPLAVPLVAVTFAEPAAIPVAVPEDDTATTAALLVDHVTVAPEITWPAESRTVAVSGNVEPTLRLVAGAVTLTLAGMGAAGGGADWPEVILE
jgi:hypothetical protein